MFSTFWFYMLTILGKMTGSLCIMWLINNNHMGMKQNFTLAFNIIASFAGCCSLQYFIISIMQIQRRMALVILSHAMMSRHAHHIARQNVDTKSQDSLLPLKPLH